MHCIIMHFIFCTCTDCMYTEHIYNHRYKYPLIHMYTSCEKSFKLNSYCISSSHRYFPLQPASLHYRLLNWISALSSVEGLDLTESIVNLMLQQKKVSLFKYFCYCACEMWDWKFWEYTDLQYRVSFCLQIFMRSL